MKTYEVWVVMSGAVRYTVTADSESEVSELAMDMADPIDCDSWDFDVDEINLVEDDDGDDDN